jgi:hypothetical protein
VANLFEHLAARVARIHARGVFRRFERSLSDVQGMQRRALRNAIEMVAGSEFGRRYGLREIRTAERLRRSVPLLTYEDIRPYVERVAAGETGALFSPGRRVLMFATSSGTTSAAKLVPVTPEFVREYRRGWNTFGVKLLTDHAAAVLRPILQVSGRMDERISPAGIPCGAITGLLARTQKGIVRRFYVGRPEIALLADVTARYYALMRFALVRDVAFAVTANPSTLIRLAQIADASSEALIRDVRDGTLSQEIVGDAAVREQLHARLRPAPQRARELENLRERFGQLRPRDYWRIEFVACWTGGSMGHYLSRLREWYGPVPVRDIGLLASEGRVTIPLEDNTPVGVLDTQAAFFEFIPADDLASASPRTLLAHELLPQSDYGVVLTNHAGLVRYRLDDVVRVHGLLHRTPLLEFLYRAGGVSSVAGEKLTENQVVAAVRATCERHGIPFLDFVLAPCWGEPPYYRVSSPEPVSDQLLESFDEALRAQNEEYDSRRKSFRLGRLQHRLVSADAMAAMDRRLLTARGSSAEQYKRTYLFSQVGADDAALQVGQSERASVGNPAK